MELLYKKAAFGGVVVYFPFFFLQDHNFSDITTFEIQNERTVFVYEFK
jgi:hypothetical protein